MADLHLVGIVGSLRAGSVNALTARAAVAACDAVDGVALQIHPVADVPFYDGDVEAAGLPQSVVALDDAVDVADGLILFSPEYNGSFPAVTKNVIDWLSRPPKAWTDKPLTLVATTPGPRAGLGVRTHFTAIMEHQPVRLFETHGIGSYGDKFDAHNNLTEPDAVLALTDFLTRFATFCRHPHADT